MKNTLKTKILETICLVLGIAFAIVGLYYYHMQYLCFEYTPLQFILAFVVCLGGALLSIPLSKKADKKKKVLNAVITSFIFAIVLIGLMFLINAVIGSGELELAAMVIPVYLTFIITSVMALLCVFRIFNNKVLKVILSVLIVIGFLFGSHSYIRSHIYFLLYENYTAPAPVMSTVSKEKNDDKMIIGDFYVSTTGNDSNSGTKASPFLTIEKAVEAVRNTDKAGKKGITVCIEAGEYRVSSLKLTKEDSGTEECPVTYCSYNGEVIINGGITLNSADFKNAKGYPEIAERLSADAQEKVMVIDLTKAPYSLTSDDWGKIYAIGSYHTAESYNGDYTGPLYCELFVDDIRQTVARYPDNEYLYTEEVVKTGLGKESDGALTEVKDWDKIRNPEPDIYKVNPELANRIAGWKSLDDVWMFGYWKYDWADASTPIGSFDKDTRELTPGFVSLYGTKTDAPYYFFNVLEELTTEGEWYLDREKGLLCMWEPENKDNAEIILSLSLNPVINSEADYITFDGLTVKGTRSDGVVITGNNNTVQNCLVKNVAGNALIMNGSNNLAYNNEITRTGKGGIIISGGDTESLTPGNSKADNNYIHDWSEIYQTYQPAVTLEGVGNICSHNEIANSPHEAVTYKGNNHIIEYNLIHDVCLLSDDAGAIYSGRSWVWYGNIVRYNCIYNVGSENHNPDGIYLDDAVSGHQIYGNLLINIPSNSIHVGGGRDNVITNNIILNPGNNALRFDDRAREGALENGWFTHAYVGSGDMWEALYNSPWQSETWQNVFPEYKNCTDDISKSDSPDYIPNPASTFKNNIIINKDMGYGEIYSSVWKFSDISENAIYNVGKCDEIFVDPDNGDYTIKDIDKIRKDAPDFKEIPLDMIGRVS
ncbi:MAG: hypothetical protein E7533_03775 [Ruminococcaceae bacterium]|nr:hypothetical protein [Oscillospiraceae bacterium]